MTTRRPDARHDLPSSALLDAHEVEQLREGLRQATEAARDAYRNTTRLIRLLAVIGQPRVPEQLVDEALTVLSEVFACDVTCLGHVVDGRVVLTNSCGVPEGDPAFVDGWSLTPGPVEALRRGQVVMRPLDEDHADLPAALHGLGIRSAVWAPLSGELDSGDLLLLYRSGAPFVHTDLPVLESVAYRLRLAVQDRERGAVMERLAQAGHLLARHLETQAVLDEAAGLFRRVTRSDRAWVVTLDERGAVLAAAAGGGPPDPTRWPCPVTEVEGWADVSTGGAYHGAYVDGEDTRRGAGTLLCVPVMRDGSLSVLLYAARERPRPFAQDTVEISRLFASYLRVALANAQLYRALGESEASLRLITDSISDMVSVVDQSRTYRYASPSHLRELAHDPGLLVGCGVSELVHPSERAEFDRVLDEAFRVASAEPGITRPHHKVEYRLRTGQGQWVWVESVLRPASPASTAVVLSSRVIDDRKRLEDELRRRATHDPLTGLANRVLASQRLDDALVTPYDESWVGALFCDLDKFKAVNDRLGHEAGDDLLLQVADRLRTCVRAGDLLARFGGDEFVIVVDEPRGAEDLVELGRRVLGVLDPPFTLRGERVEISASIGGVLGARGRSTASAMLRDADAAMYAAKERGGGQVEVFDDAASRRSLDRLGIRSDLQLALDRGQMSVHYQPVYGLDTGEILGFEALLRWTHPVRGEVAPEVFVPLAEETGAIGRVGRWVFDQACRQLAAWNALLPGRRMGMSINLSAAQLRRPATATALLSIVDAAGVDPDDIWFEITERGHVPDDAMPLIANLRAAGVHFALDDFGMSHSNLSHLRQLPVERLKIDRSFVAGLTEQDVDRGIVNAVRVIADSLGLDVIAEGVETRAQRDTLLNLGCHQGQGYLLSPPLTAAEATALLLSGEPTSWVGSRAFRSPA